MAVTSIVSEPDIWYIRHRLVSCSMEPQEASATSRIGIGSNGLDGSRCRLHLPPSSTATDYLAALEKKTDIEGIIKNFDLQAYSFGFRTTVLGDNQKAAMASIAETLNVAQKDAERLVANLEKHLHVPRISTSDLSLIPPSAPNFLRALDTLRTLQKSISLVSITEEITTTEHHLTSLSAALNATQSLHSYATHAAN